MNFGKSKAANGRNQRVQMHWTYHTNNLIEYRDHWISRNFGGPKEGCYAIALTIFFLGLLRDTLYVPPAFFHDQDGLASLITQESVEN